MSKASSIAAFVSGIVAEFILGGILSAISFGGFAVNAAEETPTDILAARVRDQGYACDKAQASKEETAQSAPNETVWILNCESGTYRVRLVPDLAAKIELLHK